MLFAQVGGGMIGGAAGGGPPPPPPGPPPGFIAAILITYAVIFGVVFALFLVLQILHCLAAARCLREIAPRNRTAEPGSVWLALIPCAGYIFHVIINFKLVESVKREFADRGWRPDGDHGQLWVILELVGALTLFPLWVVAIIVLMVKVNGYARQFREDEPTLGYDDRRRSRYDDDDEDADDDDRPDRRFRRRYD